eukprot:3025426-Heterocapsa_arctica.AAC.1
MEAEAKVASTRTAYHLSKVLAAQNEAESTWKTLEEDIAKEEAIAKAKDAAVRKSYFGSAVE